MNERPQLLGTVRHERGSRIVRRLRKTGFVPGIVYGKAVEPTPIAVNRRELVKLLQARAGEHGLVNLQVAADGKAKGWEKPVLIKHVEHEPVFGEVLHVDFQAIALTEQIRVKVSLVLKGDAVGVKQDGGILEHFLREVEVECLPTEIPSHLEYDISSMKIGDALHAKELATPERVRITTDPDAVLASVVAPKVEKVEEAAEAAPAEPEVIREKKPEAEAEAGAEGKAAPAKKEEKKEEK